MIDREDNFDIERNSGVPNLIDTLTCDFENGFHNDEKVKLKRKTRIIPDPVIISQTELSQAASNSSQSPFKIDIYDGHLPDALFLTEQSTGSMQYIHDDAQNWKSPRGILSNIFTSKQALPKRQIFSNPASTKHNLFEVHLVSPSHSVPTHSVMFDIPEDSSINNINNVEKPSIPTSATRNHFTSSIFSRLRTPTSPYNFDTNSSSPRNKDEVDSASPNDSHSNYNSQNGNY